MEMDLWTDVQNVVVVEMESSTVNKEKNNLDHVQLAIQRLMEQSRDNKRASGLNDEDDDDHLLAKLLSQLESLKGDALIEEEQPPAATEPKEASTSDGEIGKSKSNTESESDDEVIKELKKVRKQNKITHWLLAIMIVLTVTWQLSEVSLLLMVKNKIKNPFRSIGNMFSGMLRIKGPKIPDEEKLFKQLQIETTSLPHVTLPQLHPTELLDLNGNGGED